MDLKQFYTYTNTQSTDNEVSVTINFNKEHPIYKGHFPNNPVVPGIMQIEIITDILRNKIQETALLKKVTNIKYLNIITPEIENLVLEISYKLVDDIYKVKCNIKKEERIYTKFSGQYSLL